MKRQIRAVLNFNGNIITVYCDELRGCGLKDENIFLAYV